MLARFCWHCGGLAAWLSEMRTSGALQMCRTVKDGGGQGRGRDFGRMLRRVLAGTLGSALALQSAAAIADPGTAEALFREARTLLEAGKVDEACEKFKASSESEPSSGTLLNLAACRLRQG